MITINIPADKYPTLAKDGTLTFAGVIQKFFTVRDETGQNVGFSHTWKDEYAKQYSNHYVRRILPVVVQLFGNEMPMHEYRRDHIEAILAELLKKMNYADSSMDLYRRLILRAYNTGVARNEYPDGVLWDIPDEEEDGGTEEQNRVRTLTKLRKSFSITEELRMLRWFCSLDPETATGEEIALAMMYFQPWLVSSSVSIVYDRGVLSLDLLNLVLNITGGCGDGHDLTLSCTHQSLADRGSIADTALHGIGLLTADNLKGTGSTGLYSNDGHSRTDRHLTGGSTALVDHNSVENDLLQLTDAGVELALLILCLIVLTVFTQVTETAGNLDHLCHFFAAGGLEVVQFFLQILQTCGTHLIDIFHACRLSFPDLSYHGRICQQAYASNLIFYINSLCIISTIAQSVNRKFHHAVSAH